MENKDPFYYQRLDMVEKQMRRRDIRDSRVLEAMTTVLRHEFVPAKYRGDSYIDGPLSIGHHQTISQPYIVALMTQLANIGADSMVLEVGTGSGYQTAVLAEIAARVYSIEIVEPLSQGAITTLTALGYQNTCVKCDDGYRGWPEYAPFDAILVTAAPEQVPEPLIEQLKIGGHLIIPVGSRDQDLIDIKKTDVGTSQRIVIPVRFVPMTGEAGQP